MIPSAFLIIWLMIFIIGVAGTYKLHHWINQAKAKDDEETAESYSQIQNWFYVFIIFSTICGLVLVYIFLKGTIWESHFMEWINLGMRWMHITFGIAWIGASFYFVFLENSLNRTENIRDELAGNLWAVHGGGFYYIEKYKIAPKEIPKHLHWFKYEAYFTWLSGFSLLMIVYYFNSKSFLIDPNVLDITPTTAITISILSLIFAWYLYDFICKKLSKNGIVFLVSISLMLVFFAWFYAHVFSGRAAFIHFGAMIATLMAGNVFFIIIPGQKRMVAAAKKGLPPNPEDGKAAFLRSYTNNYLTLPVLFTMISNHFPSTYGNTHQWLVLLGITLGSAGVKHYLNLREKGQLSVWVMPVGVLILFAVAFATAPSPPKYENCTEDVSFAEVHAVINRRCMVCHSQNPSDAVWTVAPKGIMFDTADQIYNLRNNIFQQVVVSKAMPFNNNQTGITQEERDMINCWYSQGAPKE